MRLLDRYLLRELLVPLGYCLSGFMILWFAQDLITELSSFQSRKLLPLDIFDFYVVKTPEFLVLVLPIALLLALLYSLTNHARHNELTAIRAAGVSLWRLCLPYLLVGLLATLAHFLLNELCVPGAAEAAEKIRTRHVPPSPGAPGRDKVFNLSFSNARDHRDWIVGMYDSRTGETFKPKVISRQPDGSLILLYADRGVTRDRRWYFYNATEQKIAPGPDALPVLLLRSNVLEKPFSETPEQIKSEIKISAAINSLSPRGTRRADLSLAEIVAYLRLHPVPSPAQAAWLYTKLQGRLAAPWTCLVVVLIAIPFGAVSGRRNVVVGVAVSIVICFAYMVLQTVCLACGAGGYIPPWLGGWLPNLAFAVTGLGLMARLR